MRVLCVLCASFAVGGCAVTPVSFLQSTYSDTRGTTPRIFLSEKKMDVAGKCAMVNIQERIASFNAVYSEEPAKPGTKEIRVRSEVGMAAVVELEPTPTGTKISVWISNHYPLKGTLAERIANGC